MVSGGPSAPDQEQAMLNHLSSPTEHIANLAAALHHPEQKPEQVKLERC
jgi:hypothetical protein